MGLQLSEEEQMRILLSGEGALRMRSTPPPPHCNVTRIAAQRPR
jgi:hypothetical protein